MKASIIYNSLHGTTKAYAEELGRLFSDEGIENQVASIDDYNKEFLEKSQAVMLGCWTGGLFLFGQHPDKLWKKFASELPDIKGKKLILFTTYKLATGSMFRKMEACLKDKADAPTQTLKSKSAKVTDENKRQLEAYIW